MNSKHESAIDNKISNLFFFIFFFLSVVLIVASIAIPWYTLKYSPDLLILASSIESVMPISTLMDAFSDNTLLIYFLYISYPNTDSEILINIAQNVSILLLGFFLLRYLTPKAVLSILLFCFFTVFLNQFRLAIALAFCIIAVRNFDSKPKLAYLFVLISFLFHFFVAFWFVFYFSIKVFINSSYKYKVLIIFTLLLLCVIIYKYAFNFTDLRFFLYFEEEASPSRTYYFSVIFFIILRKSLDKSSQFFILITLIFSIALSFLPSLSGRIGELSIISTLFFSNLTSIKYSFPKIHYTNEQSNKMSIVLFLCFIFFIYRFTNIVINNSFGL